MLTPVETPPETPLETALGTPLGTVLTLLLPQALTSSREVIVGTESPLYSFIHVFCLCIGGQWGGSVDSGVRAEKRLFRPFTPAPLSRS